MVLIRPLQDEQDLRLSEEGGVAVAAVDDDVAGVEDMMYERARQREKPRRARKGC